MEAASLKAALIVGVAACLGGCEQVQSRYGAAEGVRAFFIAVQQGDRETFERHVDRPALRESLREQVSREAGGDPRILSALERASGPALDQMIRPETFQIGISRMGMQTSRVPTAAEISVMLRMKADDQACVGDPRVKDQCIMTFERRGDVWKLVALNPSDIRLRPASAAG